ncbi:MULTISPECIES: DNA polymerase III subunit chi [Methylosinus]|uniref:DNA polymerase III subunit chi n=1 Tax=Methylosinus trichosporium (strain ATCC 35070 / NCIMB 11131 / UNIQEM 75 / OB3b) TaxID=595536 RepID=A0A2D2D6B9_METT3|nr:MULTISPECIES: DNA polymerase III subunit chi [Methylosinus]ATQ70523.1 DNA polymerase III subunit chi [Methylosinus trichosporium OB3b]OBS50385.1 DNA polymerase III subunit chi [Methylosinus sp. 3S-1]
MTEVWFYHLQRRPLESALPKLLELSLARGWRAVVQAASPRRLATIDELLWSYDPESFLPHGTQRDGDPQSQPVFLTLLPDNPNRADVRVFIESAEAAPVLADPAAAPTQRAMVMFDGNDETALQNARAQWRTLKEAGHQLSYWRQNDDGKWEKQA